MLEEPPSAEGRHPCLALRTVYAQCECIPLQAEGLLRSSGKTFFCFNLVLQSICFDSRNLHILARTRSFSGYLAALLVAGHYRHAGGSGKIIQEPASPVLNECPAVSKDENAKTCETARSHLAFNYSATCKYCLKKRIPFEHLCTYIQYVVAAGITSCVCSIDDLVS